MGTFGPSGSLNELVAVMFALKVSLLFSYAVVTATPAMKANKLAARIFRYRILSPAFL